MDEGDHRSGVAVSIHDEAATIAEEGTQAQKSSEYLGVRRKHSDDNPMDEEARSRRERVKYALTYSGSIGPQHRSKSKRNPWTI